MMYTGPLVSLYQKAYMLLQFHHCDQSSSNSLILQSQLCRQNDVHLKHGVPQAWYSDVISTFAAVCGQEKAARKAVCAVVNAWMSPGCSQAPDAVAADDSRFSQRTTQLSMPGLHQSSQQMLPSSLLMWATAPDNRALK